MEPLYQIVYCYIQNTRWGGVLLLYREGVALFSASFMAKQDVMEKAK